MSKKMLINASHPEENRVAIVVDGILNDLDIEIAGQEQSKGNIYKAVVVRVETGLQAAFVDYGAEKLGFLQIGEIHPSFYPSRDESKGRPRIADILKRGQEILVQIVKEERGSKGAALTTFLSIPGRYMVLMPDSTTKGVSRKISEDSERKKLKKTMAELDLPERMGYIVRTAGIGKDKEELKRDFDYLVRLFEGITARKDKIKAPAQLYQESNLAIRSIRDYFSTDMDEVLIDDTTVYRDAKDFFALVMPELSGLVKQHREKRPIFSRYQIEEQIDGLSKNQIPMASGGSIVIDQTEALVAIDVNSGKMASESGIEATALKTNVEAATEVGRQLRLRDLGGLIVIDFIDMRDRKNIREVEQALRKALKDDKAKVSVGRISQFGLLEMSRQRLKPVLSVGSFLECPHCHGIGRVKSVEAQGIALLRQVHTVACKGQISEIEAKVPQEVANYLLNQKRATIIELERQLGLEVSIFGSSGMLPGEIELDIRKKSKDSDSGDKIVPISHANQIEVALAAQQENQESQETAQAEPAESPQAEQEATPDQPKKRRRRRRKKPAQTEKSGQDEAAAATPVKPDDPVKGQEAQPQTATSAGQSAASEQQKTAAGETGSAAVIEEAPNPATEATQEKKIPRRGRRPARQRSARPSGTSSATEAQGAAENKNLQESQPDTTGREPLQGEQQPATGSAASSSSKNSDNTPKASSRPRRPARRNKVESAGKETDQADSATPAPAALEKKESFSESVTEDASKAAKKKTPARSRRPSRKKETSLPAETEQASGQEQDRQAVAPSQEQPRQEASSTENAPAKSTRNAPQRRSRKTSAPSSPAKEENASSAPETEATAAEKPKRRTSQTTGKTAAARTKTAAARKTSDDSTVTQEATASKPRRTSRKKTDETHQNADDSAPAPKPQRRTRKKADTPGQQPTEDSSVPASGDESKPKRKPRSTSRKKSEQDQAPPTESTPE